MIIGIDLGTTNSAAAFWQDGKAQLIPNCLGDFLTPSAVGLSDNGEILVGMAARERQSTNPELSATGFKRLMGTEQKLKLGHKVLTPEELSGFVLASLKSDAETFIGSAIEKAIITVPAYFNDKQRRATERAAQFAGLTVDRLLNEPTAAALAFGIHQLDKEHPFLVFDLGGGTFDVSIVEIFDGIIEVRSSAGDPRLGGLDFNEALIGLVASKAKPSQSLPTDTPLGLAVLREAAERCKRQLSESSSAAFSYVWDEHEVSIDVSSEEFEQHTVNLIDQLREPVLRALRDGGIRADNLREVVMVGGATRMNVVRKAVTRLFGRFPNHTLHPDHAVALGAAIQGGLRSKNLDLEEVRMTDVCPFSLGIEVTDYDQYGRIHAGIFAPIIERNRTIPVSRIKQFHTLSDNQRFVEIGVYQGEARNVSGNVKLGVMKIAVPPKPAGEVSVNCRFTYDVSGLLEVDLDVPITGVTAHHTFGGSQLSDDEMSERKKYLAALKFHPREEVVNATLLSRLSRCYESFLGEKREVIGQMLTAFEASLERQEAREISELRAQISAQLDALEGERYL